MADNSAAQAQLQDWIERLRTLPTALVVKSAPDVATRVDGILRANIAAGRGPDGEAWPLTKDGKRALQNAGEAMTTTVDGTVILIRLVGPEALHNYGRVSGSVKRQILPSRKLPQPVNVAIRAVLGQHFTAHMAGAA